MQMKTGNYFSVLQNVVRFCALWDDCYALLDVIPQQNLQYKQISDNRIVDEQHVLVSTWTCAGVRLCFFATSPTTGSSSNFWGSMSPLWLQKYKESIYLYNRRTAF